MATTKQEAIAAIHELVRRGAELAGRISENDWQRPVYSGGWNIKQTFAHLASMGGSPGFFISMAQSGQGPPGGAGFDVDEFNAQQVAARDDKSPQELLEEFRTSHDAGVKAVESASDDLLAKEIFNFRGGTSPVLEVIQTAATGHEQEHLDDIERALKGGWPT